ncbi:hypothetical protein KBC70_01265 [Candidatus Woesebacteria bacterium]|nr:hypothetical protein [Candidatus Woesebacteria bacterium]
MNKEVETYRILSRGTDKPENAPSIGDSVSLSIFNPEALTADVDIIAEYVEGLGPYIHVIGHTIMSQISRYCDAKYLVDEQLEEGQEIGILKLYY